MAQQSATIDHVGADATLRAAEAIRALAREVSAAAGSGVATRGWLLWKGTVARGHAIYKPPRPGFGHWEYTLSLVLRADGTIVATTALSEGLSNSMHSPNYSGRSGPAMDSELLYPDVVEWDWHESVENAPAREIVDRHAYGRRFKLPLGGALRQELEAIRRDGRLPQFQFPVVTPPKLPAPPRLVGRGSWTRWTLAVWLPFCAITGTIATLLTRSWEVVDPRTELVPLSAALSSAVALGCSLAVSAVHEPSRKKKPAVGATLMVYGFFTFFLTAAIEFLLVIPKREPWVTAGTSGALSVVHPVVVVVEAAVVTTTFVLFLALQLARPAAASVSAGRRKRAVGSFWVWVVLGSGAFAVLGVAGSGDPTAASPGVQSGQTTTIRCTVLRRHVAAGQVAQFAPGEVQRGLRLCSGGNRYVALHKDALAP